MQESKTLFPKTEAALKELAIKVEKLNKARAKLRALRAAIGASKMPEDVAAVVNPDGLPDVTFER